MSSSDVQNRPSAEGAFTVAGRHILVVGGTRGLGRSISLRLASDGARVCATYVRNEAAAEDLRSVSAARGDDITLCRADITGRRGMDQFMTSVGDWLNSDRLDSVVYCAATGVHKTVDALTTRDFDWTFSLNVRAFFETIVKLMPRFAPRGSIVAVSSPGALRAAPTYSLVGASKGALEALARHFAVELGPRGIRVNILAPGVFRTEAWGVMPMAEERLADAAAKAPLGRLVSVDEVSACALFLCSDASSGMTGSTLVVDGGTSIPY